MQVTHSHPFVQYELPGRLFQAESSAIWVSVRTWAQKSPSHDPAFGHFNTDFVTAWYDRLNLSVLVSQ